MTGNRFQIAWLAGLTEGEATFGIDRGRPKIRVRMTDHDVVQRVAELCGTNKVHTVDYFHRRFGSQVQYEWTCRGRNAIEVMRAILPYMGERRAARINEILEVCSG